MRQKSEFSKTELVSLRLSKGTLAEVDASVSKDGFPSRAAWFDKAINRFLGKC